MDEQVVRTHARTHVLEPNKPTLEQLGRRWWRENRKRLLADAVRLPDIVELAFLAGAGAALQQATEILSEQDYKDELAGDDAEKLALEMEEG